MKYQIMCQGRLMAGAKEKECVERIQQITKLSEEKVRTTILNGRPKKMFASDDKMRIKRYSLAFRNAGLDIFIQSQEAINLQPLEAGYR